YFVWMARHSLADLTPLRRRVALTLRILITSLVVCAVAGLQLVHYNRDLAVMFVVDYSDSVGAPAKDAAAHYIDTAIKASRPNDKWGVVVFGREAYIDQMAGAS